MQEQRQNYEHVLVLDAGNAFTGVTGRAQKSQGKVVVEAMSLIGYDAMALGERDLRLGATVLRQRMAEATFPILSANTAISETGELLAQPYVIERVADLRIGIIGLAEPMGAVPKASGDAETLFVYDPLSFSLPYLQAVIQEADVVILLSHMGKPLDEALAAQVPGIDVILGGRNAMILPPSRYDTTGPIITQAGSRGQIVGFLELRVNSTGEVTGFVGKFHALGENYPEDPQVRALLERYPQ